LVREHSREIGYTNKEAGHFYTLSNAHHTSGWQGWTVMDIRLVDDYQIIMDSYDLLRNRQEATVSVKPYAMTRIYPNGSAETFTFLDSLDAFLIDVLPAAGADYLSFRLRFTQSHNRDDYIIKMEDGILLLALTTYDEQTAVYPGWIAIMTNHPAPVIDIHATESAPADFISSRTFAPAEITVKEVETDQTVRWVVAAGRTEAEAKQIALHVTQRGDELIAKRKLRMQKLLDDSYILTSNDRFNQAIAWSRISMDNLIMNQTGTGIYAGLPWFNNYWGRDTFIAFSGAVLVTGQFEAARQILRSFAEFQDVNPESRTYGRVPNRVTTQEIIYNTTDGTPWFVRELYQYFKYSGDSSLVKELYPVVKRSIQGALKNYVDEHYFLAHADADTWMDAVGPDGPWSPRGNRAVDIQYLWYRQLTDGAEMAALNGDTETAGRWEQIASILRKNFNDQFIAGERKITFDRLEKDGTPDTSVRPNQIFAFNMIDDDDVRKVMLKKVIGELTYPWGVASLSQFDKNFHPFHRYPPYYVPDAAYHNGIVWTWLIGRVIEAAVRYDLQDIVFGVTDNMVHQILERGGAGTFSELLDAFPREGEDEPGLSGTFTQAWNLAEFIRTAYQDYLGIRVDVPASTIHIHPKIPGDFGESIEVRIPFGDSFAKMSLHSVGDSVRVNLTCGDLAEPVTVHFQWVLPSGDGWQTVAELAPNDSLIFELNNEQITIQPGTYADFLRVDSLSRRSEFPDLHLAQPVWQDSWISLQGPDHPLLSHADVKRDRGNAELLFDIEDGKYDDKGPTGSYTYPTSPNFRDGILDITRFSVWYDTTYTYFRLGFRNLHNPGFHPHYGFQLTYAGILIDRGMEGKGMEHAGANSNYTIDPALGTFDRAIYVGGGLRVVDVEHSILCEYLPVPEDVVNPLGNTRKNEVTFSIPNNYLGVPTGAWRYIVLVGAQDDHGGAGIGVFREVQDTAGEWHGGGKQNPCDPNVYDILLPSVEDK
jgi:glycogen debranching enzyme